jgi:hypothetical protein
MTVNKLYAALGKLIKGGYGRKQVCVNTSTFTHPLEEDGVLIMPVCLAELNTHEMLDDDGGLKVLANGCTAERTALVLYGEAREGV